MDIISSNIYTINLLFRSRADVEVRDSSGSIAGTLFGFNAEKFLGLSAEELMMNVVEVFTSSKRKYLQIFIHITTLQSCL